MTFPDFDSLPKTRNINYNIQNMQHLFTFLAPRNLNQRTLELFFSLNQRFIITILYCLKVHHCIIICLYNCFFYTKHAFKLTAILKFPYQVRTPLSRVCLSKKILAERLSVKYIDPQSTYHWDSW